MTDKRDFEINGLRFHLNDNPTGREYEGKYKVLIWNESYKRWQETGFTFNSLREARRALSDMQYTKFFH